MLLGSEPDLKAYPGEPMAFLIFGQGRVLWGLVGKGINAENVQEACSLMTAPCSCQIKSMNPGTDLLTSTDWYGFLEGRLSIEQVTPADLTVVAPRLEGREPIEPKEKRGRPPLVRSRAPSEAESRAVPANGDSSPFSVLVGPALVLGLMLALAAAATIFLVARKRQE
jgi:hypothetical protein